MLSLYEEAAYLSKLASVPKTIYTAIMNQYKIFNPPISSIALPVQLYGLPEYVCVGDMTLLRKSAFHVSLICTGKICEKEGMPAPQFHENILKDFEKFIKTKPVAFTRFTNEFRLVSEGEKRTIIAMCEVSNLNLFFDAVDEKYNLQLEYPPLHVTLYTLQPDVGIFVTDKADIENLTTVIPSPFKDQDLNNFLESK